MKYWIGYLMAAVTATATAGPFIFTPIDVPGATSTAAQGINDLGQIVGHFSFSTNGIPHGFILTGGSYRQIDAPGSTGSVGTGINNAGEIVGQFARSIATHGFLGTTPYNPGNFTQIDVPGATFTSAFGINAGGQIVGVFIDSAGKDRGFLDSGGSFTAIDVPGATANNALGINTLGQIVGIFTNGSLAGPVHGYLDAGGTFVPIDVPGATSTQAEGINTSGQIVGRFVNGTGAHGFLDSGGSFTAIDVPGGTGTTIFGINGVGQLVGSFGDNAGTHGFLATPVVLPSAVASSGAKVFDTPVVAQIPIFIDPLLAIGYDYAIGAGDPLFDTVTLPSGVGDNLYTLSFDGQSFALAAGLTFDFTKYFAEGVDAFRVTGIETSAGLNATDPLAFPTEVSFVGSGRFTGTMTPITASIPEPAVLALLGIGLAGLGLSRSKHLPNQLRP